MKTMKQNEQKSAVLYLKKMLEGHLDFSNRYLEELINEAFEIERKQKNVEYHKGLDQGVKIAIELIKSTNFFIDNKI